MRIRYTCSKYPRLAVGRCQFDNGAFETDDPELQDVLSRSIYAHFFAIELLDIEEPKQVDPAPRAKRRPRKAAK